MDLKLIQTKSWVFPSPHMSGVELCSMALYKKNISNPSKVVTVDIRQTNFRSGSSPPSLPVSVTARVEFLTYTFHFPSDDSGSVILLPNRQYRITMSSPSGFSLYSTNDGQFSCSYFSVTAYDPIFYSRASIYCIEANHYKTLSPKWTHHLLFGSYH